MTGLGQDKYQNAVPIKLGKCALKQKLNIEYRTQTTVIVAQVDLQCSAMFL